MSRHNIIQILLALPSLALMGRATGEEKKKKVLGLVFNIPQPSASYTANLMISYFSFCPDAAAISSISGMRLKIYLYLQNLTCEAMPAELQAT